MAGFLDGFRRGYDAGRAGAGKEQSAREQRGAANGDDRESFAEVTELAGRLEARVDELEAARAQKAEELQARVDELEAAREKISVFADVLKFPGVKMWLLAKFHSDKHPNANEAERAVHTQNMQKINAAYEIVERRQ